MSSLQASVRELEQAWNFMWATRKRRLLVLAPVFLNLLLWATVIPMAFIFVKWAMSLSLPDAWWAAILTILAGFFAVAAAIVLALFVFAAFTTVIGAPFYGALAEDAMREVGMVIKEISWPREMARALAYTLKLGALFIVLQLGLILFNVIPGIGTVMHFIGAFVVAILLLSMEFFGEAFAKDSLPFRSRLAFLVRHHRSIIAFAIPVFFLLLVPVLNFVVPPLAVVAASRMYAQAVGGKE